MAFTNYSTKEINCKIIYFGPANCGKTATLRSIYTQTSNDNKTKIKTLQTPEQHTPFFDFLPLSAGFFQNFHIKLHLYTLPVSRFFSHSRTLILKGVDGIVFIAGSELKRLKSNQEAFDALTDYLESVGTDLSKIPTIFQYNKRDTRDPIPTKVLSNLLNRHQRPEFETIATENVGTLEAFTEISKLVLHEIKKGTESIK